MIDYNKPILNKDGEPLKLLEAAAHFCVRAIKKTNALRKIGYETHGMGNMLSYGTENFDTYTVWKDERQFKNSVKMYIDMGVDIITYDNEPDYPVKWISEVIRDNNSSVKLVVDLHDLDSIRRGTIPIPEREMFNLADALIYVSMPIQSITNELHRVNKPNIVLLSYCNEGIVEYDEDKIGERKGVVYEGGANPPEDNELNTVFAYRSLFSIIKRLVEMGNETYMYCGNISAFDTYQPTGAVIFPPTQYKEMMEKMTAYKYGALIFNNHDGKKDQVNYTLTNKEHEYLQAGLPSLACWCPESMKHVSKHGIGFTYNHIDEIGNVINLENKYMEIMNNIKIKRKELVMENFIFRIEQLYADLIGVPRKGIPKYIRDINIFEYGKEDVNNLLK